MNKKVRRRNTMILTAFLIGALVLFFCYYFYQEMLKDNTPPTISFDENELEVTVLGNQDDLLKGVYAYDEEDGDVTDSILIESVYGVDKTNRVNVTYAAFDSVGNVSKKERSVHLKDYIHPQITLKDDLIFEYETKFDVMNIVGATDVIDGDLSSYVKANLISETTSLNVEGVHEVAFSVTNSLGDTRELVLPVEVVLSNLYNAKLTLTDYIIYLPVNANFEPRDYLETFVMQQNHVDLSSGVPYEMDLSIENNVDTTNEGFYTVNYSMTSGNYRGYTKLFVVIEGVGQ